MFRAKRPLRARTSWVKWRRSTDAIRSGGSPDTCVTHDDDMPWRRSPSRTVRT